MARVRVHQHVNPLATYFRQLPVKAIEFENIFADPKLPLFIDIGCGRGRFLLKMAQLDRAINYLGLEIREPLVNEGNEIAQGKKLENLQYEFCNATLALDKLLEKLPGNTLHTVTIQFPDPWFKKRHAKRRMVNANLIRTIVKHLNERGRVFIQSDVEVLAEEMFENCRQQKYLKECEISENPFPVKTEREISVEDRSLPVFRRIFEKIAV